MKSSMEGLRLKHRSQREKKEKQQSCNLRKDNPLTRSVRLE